ncbi:unnamed protein product [Alternaria alternata]
MTKVQSMVASSRRKSRKAHFSAPSSVRRVIMSAPLSKELREKRGCAAFPSARTTRSPLSAAPTRDVRARSPPSTASSTASTSTASSARRATASPFPSPSLPSKVVITKLKLDKDREQILERKSAGREEKKKQREA